MIFFPKACLLVEKSKTKQTILLMKETEAMALWILVMFNIFEMYLIPLPMSEIYKASDPRSISSAVGS